MEVSESRLTMRNVRENLGEIDVYSIACLRLIDIGITELFPALTVAATESHPTFSGFFENLQPVSTTAVCLA